ncbi:MAG TPA: hypothetical protein VIM99_03795 [Blastocatellia bacterium]
MKQTFGSDQTIIRYLLNELSEDDQARFEEAYFSDGRLFEQVRALEEELIDDYVKGDLSGDERRRFENHYFASEQRRARIEAARQLIDLCSLKAPARTAPSESVEGWLFSLRRRLHFPALGRLAPICGVAAAALLLLATGLAIQLLWLRGQQAPVVPDNEKLASVDLTAKGSEQRKPHDPEPTPEEVKQNAGRQERPGNRKKAVEPPQIPPRVPDDQTVFLALRPSLRSINRPDRAIISDNAKFVNLQVELEMGEPSPSRSYRAIVRTVDGNREVWRQEGLKLQRRKAANYVLVSAPADRFRAAGAQGFVLTISATAGKDYEDVESFYFQATADRK